jgi:hypothetical protein
MMIIKIIKGFVPDLPSPRSSKVPAPRPPSGTADRSPIGGATTWPMPVPWSKMRQEDRPTISKGGTRRMQARLRLRHPTGSRAGCRTSIPCNTRRSHCTAPGACNLPWPCLSRHAGKPAAAAALRHRQAQSRRKTRKTQAIPGETSPCFVVLKGKK